MQETADFSAAALARSLLRRSRQGALATLMPPDLHEYGPYLAFRENAGKATPIPEPLRSAVSQSFIKTRQNLKAFTKFMRPARLDLNSENKL